MHTVRYTYLLTLQPIQNLVSSKRSVRESSFFITIRCIFQKKSHWCNAQVHVIKKVYKDKQI